MSELTEQVLADQLNLQRKIDAFEGVQEVQIEAALQ